MTTFRFDASPQSLLSPDSRVISNSIATGTDRQQLASEIARLAGVDAASAAEVTRDFFASTPSSSSGEFAAAIAANLDDTTLGALAQAPAGRELIAMLDRFCLTGSVGTGQQAQLARLRDAQFSGQPTTNFAWAGLSMPQNLRPALLSSMAQVQSTSRNAPSPEEKIKSAFKEEFAAKAANKQEFDALMKQVYGDNYDKDRAEQYRQQALRGDFSFLPEVKLVDAATLQGGKGAYNEAEGVVYINRDIAASDPDLAAQVFVEEAGAHLDAKLNTADTQGDEGEMFRRVLSGEQLSAREIDAIRNDNDKGTITVDGKKVEVEFWFGEDFVDAVGDAVSEIGDAVKEVVVGAINAVENFMRAVAVDIFGGVFMNLIQGRVADAFDSFINGVDKAVFGTVRRAFNAALTGVAHFYKAFTHILPDKLGGDLARNLIDRASDIVRTVGNACVDITRNTWRMPFEIYAGFAQDIGGALKYWARGDVGGGFERLGMAFVNPFRRAAGTIVDNAMIVGQGIGNVITAFNPEAPPSRGLSKPEREYLKSVYGDSLNLEDIRIHRGNISHKLGAPAPHTVGNDIYIPDESKYWNPDSSLTEEGKLLLVHEAAHVYQAQKGGNDYIHGALLAQIGGEMKSGNRNAGYDFEDELKSGKPFSEWNPEQQAEFIETMTRARDKKLNNTTDLNGDRVNEDDFDFNNNGRIDADELARAFYDQDGNGMADQGKTAFTFSDADMQRAYAIWNTLQADRPDRTLIA